jgi:hypothetical protein
MASSDWVPPDASTPVSASSDLPTMLEPMPAPTGVPVVPVPAPWIPPIGNWRKKSNPPLLGRPATSIRQIVLAPQNPASRFTGPVLSGEKDGVVVGSAILQIPMLVDATMGSFTLPMQFEAVSLILWMVTMTYAPFNGNDSGTPRQPSVSFGSSPGGGEIFPQDGLEGTLHVLSYREAVGTLPYAVDPNPFLGYLTVNQYGATQGQGLIMIGYARV